MQQAPNIKKLDEYIGFFYEDNIDHKINASKLVFSLFQDFNNLQALLQHDSLLPVLARTLAENHKRNIDLNVYILSMFYILSNYKQFQELLTEQQVGKTIVDVMENQVQRFDLLYSQYIQMWRKNDEKDKITAKAQLKKLNILIWKQDKLFFVCLNILLNISFNPIIEKKMKKAGIVQVLVRCLERNDFHLLIVTLVFLKKLSVMNEFKDQMVAIGLIDKLERFFTCENQILLAFSLQIYYNLAFDKSARQAIQKASLIPKFVHLLTQNTDNRGLALRILYLLSTDIGIRYTLAYTNCMDYVVKLILFPQPGIKPEDLLALAINLTANERNVQHLNIDDFAKIATTAITKKSPIFLKLLKNILKSSKSQQIHGSMIPFIKQKIIKTIMTQTKNQQMCLQLLGILANSKIGKEWTDIILQNQKLIDYLQKVMISGITEDDYLLQVIVLVGNIAQEAECASLIEQLFESILSLFVAKEYDPQLITQLLYTIYSFIFHGVGLERILSEGEVLMKILELIEDPNEGVRDINDEVLTVLRQTDDIQLNENIKQSKFYKHNKKWLTQTQGIHDWVYDNGEYGYNQEMLDPRMWESEDDYD